MKALRSMTLSLSVMSAGDGAARADFGYINSHKYKDVKFIMDQCSISSSRLSTIIRSSLKRYFQSARLKKNQHNKGHLK